MPPPTSSPHPQVRGKVNALSIDSCRKTGVVFDHVIASCELVNCGSMQVQCTGAVPTVSVDKCDGAQVFVTQKLAASDFQVGNWGAGMGENVPQDANRCPAGWMELFVAGRGPKSQPPCVQSRARGGG